MGIEKQGSKGGNYVGGFLQMFDWNAKSRKKLFSSKSDVPELSKQKKRCDGNLPTTRLQMLDVDEIAAGSSIRGSSDYSCASSVTDEDFYGTKAPGVVARLMGLDSLPKSNISEHYSTPLFDSQSLQDAYYRNRSREYFQDQMMHSGSLQNVPVRNDVEPNSWRPIEKFRIEILPPKSAKSIPITHHKLLSPIKSANFIPHKDAAYIMEAAARIIERGPQTSTKKKLPTVGSSLVPLRLRDLKEKAQKPSKVFEGGSQRKAESSGNLKGHSMNRSWNGSSIRVAPDSEESSIAAKNKGKSVSLALQAKANVQKREGLNANSSRSVVSQKESCELSPNQIFKSQAMSMRKSTSKKPSLGNGSSVLRQNNQKQNCIVDRGKLLPSKGGKTQTLSGESSSARPRSSSKLAGTSKVSSRKLGSEVKDDKCEVLSSRSERITSKKRSVDGNYHLEKDQNGKAIQSSSTSTDRRSCWDQDSGSMGTEVISFTFTAPMTRSGLGSGGSTEAGENTKIFSAGSQSKRSQLSSNGTNASKFSYLGHNVKGGDALSTLLEQKLKELALKVVFSPEKSGTVLHHMVPGPKDIMSSTTQERNQAKDRMHIDNQGVLEETSMSESNFSLARNIIDRRLPSPVSVLEYSSFANSWNSSDTGDSNSMGGSRSKQYSSLQALDMRSLKSVLKIEGDAELSDSASSTSNGTVAKMQLTGNRRRWELDYVKKILYNIDLMFKDYALGRTHEIISPHLFNQLENWIGNLSTFTLRINRRLVFDCVSECLDLRCTRYVSGGCKLWAKGLSTVRRKDRLAEEVCKEISGWSAVGDSMIDEIVDKDMSSQQGRWLDFDIETFELGVEIESWIFNSLMDEVLADILVL